MNQPNSPRSSDDPAAKNLAQGLFGLNFAPGGPVADPDDLDGLDFDLLPDAPPAKAVVAPIQEAPVEEISQAAEEQEPILSKVDPVPPKVEKTRRSAPRIRVPRDDDDDGFGAGLLDAFDDDDDDDDGPADVSVSVERVSVMKFAEIEVPADDELPAKPARKPRADRKSSSAKSAADKAEAQSVASPDDRAPEAEAEVASDKPKDDYWDALEGWDWEISESSADSEPAAKPVAAGGRGRSPRRSPDRETGTSSRSDDRPRREKPVHEKPAREVRVKSSDEAPARVERPARAERKPKPEAAPSSKADSILDEGGFADDLFERLEPKGRTKKPIPLSQLAAELDDEPAVQDPGARGDAEESSGRGRRRGRGTSPDRSAPVRSESAPVRHGDSAAPVDDYDDDDGFGSGLTSSQRAERNPVERETSRSRRSPEPDERPSRPARRPREEVARDDVNDEPPRRRPGRDEVRADRSRDEVRADRSRDDEPAPSRARVRDTRDADREERPRRDRDDRPTRPVREERATRDDRPARDDRPTRDDRPARVESTESPRRSRRDERPSRDDDSEELDRPKVKTVEVPTWEHAISLLVRRPPKQDRGGGDRPSGGPRGDDRGARSGRGRRRSNES